MADSKLMALVAEDDPALGDILRVTMERAGLETHLAKNGAIALELAMQHPFSLVCCDYQMPKFNGEEVLRAIRREGPSRDAMCILCSAKSFELDCQRLTEELALDAVFFKPFSLTAIARTVRSKLEL